MDIRQFAGRGIPIYEELAKVLGVTKDEVSNLVTEGKVGFAEVEKAFQNMTGKAGTYYNLMQEQSKAAVEHAYLEAYRAQQTGNAEKIAIATKKMEAAEDNAAIARKTGMR